MAQQARWTVLQVNFVAGLTSVNVERFEKALETLGVPKQKWAQVRTKFMRVLLEEHDNILRSYQAQKHGSGDGMGAIAGQRMEGLRNFIQVQLFVAPTVDTPPSPIKKKGGCFDGCYPSAEILTTRPTPALSHAHAYSLGMP